MLGATTAGMAFSNASVALVHGMSRPIGAFFPRPARAVERDAAARDHRLFGAGRARALRRLRPRDGDSRRGRGKPGRGCPPARRIAPAQRGSAGPDAALLGHRCRALRRAVAGDGEPGDSPRVPRQTTRECLRATRSSIFTAACTVKIKHGPITAAPHPALSPQAGRGQGEGRSQDCGKNSVELDLDLLVDDAHRVGLQIFGRRRVEHLSGADIKAGGMQRALDQLAVEPAVGEPGIGMSADVVGREKSAVDVVKRDRAAGDLDAQRLAFGQIADGWLPGPSPFRPRSSNLPMTQGRATIRGGRARKAGRWSPKPTTCRSGSG